MHSTSWIRSRSLRLALAAAALVAGNSARAFQQEEPPSTEVLYPYDSGKVENRTNQANVILSFPVQVSGARWLRLNFTGVQLSGDPLGQDASILRLTALSDGDVQEQNAIHVRQWQSHSCYFNGDSVLVEVFAHPGTGANRVVLHSVTAGLDWLGDTICGPVDDRVLSYDGRAARLLPIGCTGWIINDCKSCMLTAGHCSTTSLQTAEFNVPLSSGSGSLNHPPASDQYAVDVASKQTNGGQGIGNDWGYFGCFPNPNTGLTPFEKQLVRYSLALPPPFNGSQTIRITGYGTDSGTSNQVQQTHSGPWVTLSGSTVQYQTDTTGGNSGSPVIHEPSGNAIGIHTHGGCNSNGTGQNSGTASNHSGLQAALAAPKGVCLGAPCSGVGTNFCLPGALTSVISGTGSSSIAANDLVLHANNIPLNKTGIFIYSLDAQQVSFRTGYLCVGGGNPIVRLPGVSSGNSGTFTYPIDYGALPGAGQINSGSTWHFQAWFRSGPGLTDLSNGLRITFVP
jgi:V8-like Glu-specific endopeptidase